MYGFDFKAEPLKSALDRAIVLVLRGRRDWMAKRKKRRTKPLNRAQLRKVRRQLGILSHKIHE